MWTSLGGFRKKEGNNSTKKAVLTLMTCLLITASLVACSPAKESTEATTTEVPAASANNTQSTEKEDEAAKEAEEAIAKAKAEEEAKRKAEEEALEANKQTQVANAMTLIVPHLAPDKVLQQKTIDYLVANHQLFPAVTAETKEAAKNAVDKNITSRHLFKNVTPYLDKMFSVQGSVVQVTEEESDMGTIATVHIMDESGNSIVGIYFGSTGDILDGDQVRLRGVPTASYSFDNIGGGTTNAILLTVSTVQKV
ncbi:hypothetical protein NQ117_11930 [Paenibacillus sp. SC116]|uniref:hypothetical protein n=1 Tax=Paenibacillus sp. SC116 TaxID=2968986 RepID=UPI00215A5A92|nr:hypothetical protein [Paenibacillus sp. SC116]MCR8844394.1 hypothetical protein [Paenibacillus sp. SC116]